MKNLTIAFIVFSIMGGCSKQPCTTNESTEIEPLIDSVEFNRYKRSNSFIVELKRPENIYYVDYFQLVKGHDGYFCIYYDSKEQFGKQFKYVYQIFKQQNISMYFDEVDEYNINLLLIDTFNISINNLNYKIEKYGMPNSSINRKDSFTPPRYHYINDNMGLLAIETGYAIYVAAHNTMVNDSVMSYISKGIIKYMEPRGNLQ